MLTARKERRSVHIARNGHLRYHFRGVRYDASDLIAALVLLLPTFIFLYFIFILPLFDVVSLSFTNFSMVTGKGNPVGFTNYTYLWGNARFWKALANTSVYAALKLSLDASLALLLATMLDKHIPFKRFLRAAYFAPVVVPVVASSLIWIWFYDPSIGPFNQILSILGLPKSRWLYDENMALFSILLFSIWKGLGYNISLCLAGLQNIPDSYIEAARIDGASEPGTFWQIKFPLLKPITSFVLMIGIINSFKVFTEVNVMMPKNSSSSSTMLIVNYIYDQAFTNGRMGRAAAASLLLFIVIFVLTMLQRLLNTQKSVNLE